MSYWSMDCGVVRKVLSMQVLCVRVHVVCEIARLKRSPLENLGLKTSFIFAPLYLNYSFPHINVQDHEIFIAHIDICLFINCKLRHILQNFTRMTSHACALILFFVHCPLLSFLISRDIKSSSNYQLAYKPFSVELE